MSYLACSLAVFAVASFSAADHADEPREKPDKVRVYIGTYTGKDSKGIYRCDLDLASGKLSNLAVAAETINPSFLALHPNGRFLYAVGEVEELKGKESGGLSAFAIDAKTGDLKLLNQEASGGGGPCHIVVDKAGKNVLAANYGGGSVCVCPIKGDGSLAPASAFIQHKGSSVNKERQEGPHAHSINLDAAGRFAFAADLGLDKVLIYEFDPAKGALEPNDPPAVDLAPGAGPRHFAFHPGGKFAYVINEMNSTVTAMNYEPVKGSLKTTQSISTLPKDFKGNTSTAEVVVHPSGKFLYGSNRGHDSIAVFKIDDKTGELTFVGHQTEGIKTPRNFALDPSGKNLLVGNQGSDSVIVFRVNEKTGELMPTGNRLEVPAPVCLRMLAR
ncbi:MAG: lactonase family protein [Planctomycetes bacterium]|nr:lactonase family protein [Planctomycetota bacterium]